MVTKLYKPGDKVVFQSQVYTVTKAWSDGDLDLVDDDDNEIEYINQHRVKRWEEPKMTSAKLGLISKGILGVKLKIPHGVNLNENEAKYIIDGWEEQKTVVKSKQNELVTVSAKIDRHLAKTNQEIPEAMKEMKLAKTNYLKCKDPLAKRKWARKVVVRTAYYEQVRNSAQNLNATVSRVKDAVDDAQYVYKTLESRIAEARIYRELNGGLKLVGKSLIEARQKHIMPEIEYQSLEVTMEDLEEMNGQMNDDQVLIEAEKIVTDKERWTADEQAKATK